MKSFTITVTDEEYKALAWDILSPQDWIEYFMHEKAHKVINRICILAFSDKTNTIINAPDKKKIQALLHAAGYDILRIEEWPYSIKQAAVSFANLKGVAE